MEQLDAGRNAPGTVYYGRFTPEEEPTIAVFIGRRRNASTGEIHYLLAVPTVAADPRARTARSDSEIHSERDLLVKIRPRADMLRFRRNAPQHEYARWAGDLLPLLADLEELASDLRAVGLSAEDLGVDMTPAREDDGGSLSSREKPPSVRCAPESAVTHAEMLDMFEKMQKNQTEQMLNMFEKMRASPAPRPSEGPTLGDLQAQLGRFEHQVGVARVERARFTPVDRTPALSAGLTDSDDEADEKPRRSKAVDGRPTLSDAYRRIADVRQRPRDHVEALGGKLRDAEPWPFAGVLAPRVTEWLVPQLLAEHESVLMWARAWIGDHSLRGTITADRILRNALVLDHAMGYDRRTQGFNVLQSSAMEVVGRDLFGIMKAYEGFEDFAKAPKAGKGGKDAAFEPAWREHGKYDVVACLRTPVQIPEAEEVVHREEKRRALARKYLDSA